MAAAKLPKAFWSTSEEAIHKAQVAETGELEQEVSAILLSGLNAAIGSQVRQRRRMAMEGELRWELEKRHLQEKRVMRQTMTYGKARGKQGFKRDANEGPAPCSEVRQAN
jgi:hypothetical protein